MKGITELRINLESWKSGGQGEGRGQEQRAAGSSGVVPYSSHVFQAAFWVVCVMRSLQCSISLYGGVKPVIQTSIERFLNCYYLAGFSGAVISI